MHSKIVVRIFIAYLSHFKISFIRLTGMELINNFFCLYTRQLLFEQLKLSQLKKILHN